MPNACVVLLVKSPFREGPAHVHQTTHFMQQAYFHKKANRCCKSQASGCGESDGLASLSEDIIQMKMLFL